ncbi:sulfotransferase family protein [Marinobacter salarius]|jgi:hypothetical protein|nr:sulfotransferase [Marinobacter salarius]
MILNIKQAVQGLMPLGTGKDKIIVAGMPKSGTTAIAKLLGASIQSPVCSDPFHQLDVRRVEYREALFSGELSVRKLWKEHRDVFSGRVIKDPNFPLFIDDLRGFLPDSDIVFIIRDPRSNIRSILNRLGISGDPCDNKDKVSQLKGAWFNVLSGVSPEFQGDDYLEKIAWRWRVSAENYLRNEDSIRLIRYEDFNVNKKGQIESLVSDLGLTVSSDISAEVDVQYQPKGKNSISFEDFFGVDNLARINKIVSPLMARFGYEV